MMEKQPQQESGSTNFRAFNMMRGFSEGRAEDLFGPIHSEQETSREETFGDMSELERLALMNSVASLAAEHRDITRSLAGERIGEEDSVSKGGFRALSVNGILVRIPSKEVGGMHKSDRRKKAIEVQEKRLQDIKETLIRLGARPGVREAYEQQVSELYIRLHVLREAQHLKKRVAVLDAEINEAVERGRTSDEGHPVGIALEEIRMMRKERDELFVRSQLLATPESFGPLIQRVTELQNYATQVRDGMLVQVPTVRRVRDAMLENIYAHRHFIVYGHTGGGKTELARQVAQQYMLEQGIGIDREALAEMSEHERGRVLATLPVEVLSASEETSIYDMIAKTKLAPGEASNPRVLAKEAQDFSDELAKSGIKVPAAKMAELLLGKGNITRTIAQYGPVARALRDGKPVIIDEINLMRPEARGALNYLLTAKVGDRITFPQNGEDTFIVPPGFVVIATENRGAEYAGVQRAGAAQKSRFAELELPYPELAELFDIILAPLLRRDRATLPPDFPSEEYHKLAMLALVAYEVQVLFAGNTQAQLFMFRTRSGPAVSRIGFKHFVLSPRILIRDVVEQWMDGGFAKSLDDIIAEKMVTKAAGESGNNDEQKLLVEKLIMRGFFQGWTAERFSKAGVQAVSEEELLALQAAISSGDATASDAFAEFSKDALARARTVEGAMLMGNRARNTAAMTEQES